MSERPRYCESNMHFTKPVRLPEPVTLGTVYCDECLKRFEKRLATGYRGSYPYRHGGDAGRVVGR